MLIIGLNWVRKVFIEFGNMEVIESFDKISFRVVVGWKLSGFVEYFVCMCIISYGFWLII